MSDPQDIEWRAIGPAYYDVERLRRFASDRGMRLLTWVLYGKGFGSDGCLYHYEVYLTEPTVGLRWVPKVVVALSEGCYYTYELPRENSSSIVDFATDHAWDVIQENWWQYLTQGRTV